MLNFIARNKFNYHKGQIFPFIIVIVVVLMMMLMITINLGNIALYKTDVSNAADAAALSGSSMLSAGVMGLGMVNMGMAVRAIITFVFVACEAATIVGIPVAVCQLVAHMVKSFSEYINNYVNWVGIIGQAKKTAMQYAWQNAGVDELRPSFQTFVRNMYGQEVSKLTASERSMYQGYYEVGYDPSRVQESTEAMRSGYADFMNDDGNGQNVSGNGWWRYCRPKPNYDNIIPSVVFSAYGWNNDQGTANPNCRRGGSENDECATAYAKYDNYVSVNVKGPMLYDFKLVTLSSDISCVSDYVDKMVKYVEDNLGIPGWLSEALEAFKSLGMPDLMADIIEYMENGMLSAAFPMSIGFNDPEVKYFYDHPIEVSVTRYKKRSDVGMWRFTYGGRYSSVTGTAKAVLYDDRAMARGDSCEGDADGCVSVYPNILRSCEKYSDSNVSPCYANFSAGGIVCQMITNLVDVLGEVFTLDFEEFVEKSANVVRDSFGDSKYFVFDTRLIEVQ